MPEVAADVHSLLTAANKAAMRTVLELVPGTNVAAYNAEREKLGLQGTDVASASTTNLETATGQLIDVTGTTTITAITLSQGHVRLVRFTGILTLTHGASLVLPTGANITTAAGDIAIFAGYASSVVRCIGYLRANGQPLAGGGGGAITAPYVYHVATDGNNTTGDGSPSAPYLTAQKAYDEGVIAAVPFAIRLGVGTFTITLTATWNTNAKQVTGAGNALTNLTVTGTPPDTTNDNGANGYAIQNVDFRECYVNLISNGQSSAPTDTNTYSAGTGGAMTITGNAFVTFESKGGSGLGPGDGIVSGGTGGIVICSGGLTVLGWDLSGGNGINYGSPDGTGPAGEFDACQCDLRAVSSYNASITRIGGCAIVTGLFITDDNGGNSSW